ncbi:TcdB_toxin_midN domain-containing protein [Gammaproteobacteria bacterium]
MFRYRPVYTSAILVMLIALMFCVFSAQAGVDKSGVKPSVLSLPSGPGAIEGLGESFEPQLNSGTSSYTIKLVVPPGRAGFAPVLNLRYNSGNGSSPFGLGWVLNLPAIQRQTDKRLPYYTDYPNGDHVDNDQDGEVDEFDEFDTFIVSTTSSEELVPQPDSYYRLKNEEEFTRFTHSSNGWLAQYKNGIHSKFGFTPQGRIEDGNGHIFKWLLEEMVDLNGNVIVFRYTTLDRSHQRYLSSITYNRSDSGSMEIYFDYELRPDVLVDYRPTFELKTAYRCSAVRMLAAGQPIHSYRLEYAPTGATQPLSLLRKITQVGQDQISTLPPAEFGYTAFRDRATWSAMPSAPRISLNDGNIDLLDIDGDGLPDILNTNDTPHGYYHNLGPDENGQVRWDSYRSMSSSIGVKYLSANTTQLADLDGDGRTELMDLFGTDVNVFKLSNANQSIAWRENGIIAKAGFNFLSPDVRLVDLNNDKLIDVMQTNASDNFVWLNNGKGGWSQPFMPPAAHPQLKFDRVYTKLADMNGDRMLDLVWLQNELCVYYPSMGFGKFGTKVTVTNPPFGIINENALIMADVNGDGMSDVLYVMNGSVQVWINLGLNPENHATARFAAPFTVAGPLTNSYTTFRQADVNGNGSVDILLNTAPGGGNQTFTFLDFASGEQPYQLKTITNGIGRTTTITYRSSIMDLIRDREAGQNWPENIPFPMSVVAKIEEHDGLATYTRKFSYHNGYYDGKEKQFRGFAGAERVEAGDTTIPDLITRYQFDTGVTAEALKGKVLSVTEQNAAGQTFHTETYAWTARKLLDGTGGDPRSVVFARQDSKLRTVTERGNGNPVQLRWEYDYDDYGNTTRVRELGRLDDGWDDERVSMTSYSAGFPAGLAAWILDRPIEHSITNENGQLATRQRHYYDGNDTLGVLTKGNETRTEDWVRDNTYVASKRSDYDLYGNVIALYDPLYDAAAKERGHYREIQYDPQFHTFPIQESIYTGKLTLTAKADVDLTLGVIKKYTDFNGFTIDYDYDKFGRLISVRKPGDSGTTTEYGYTLAHKLADGSLINWVDVHQRESDGGGTVDSRHFYNGLGHKLMTRAEGEIPGQVVVSDTVQLNARQKPWRQYLPYFETDSSLDYRVPTFASAYIEHHYDSLGREVKAIQPTGEFSETEYRPLSRLVRDEEQTSPLSPHYGAGMLYIEDGLQNDEGAGRLREVQEIVKIRDDGEPTDTPTTWITRYRYDLKDNLTGYTDSQNNQKFIEYDGLGHQTFMNDPDRGQVRYDYDAASNLIRTLDAKNQTIRYEYDGVNRITAEYFSATGTNPEVEYHYDEPAGWLSHGEFWSSNNAEAITPTNRAEKPLDLQADHTRGYLAWVRDQSGEEHQSYDSRGRVAWTIKRIADPAGQLRTFYTGMTYDSMDRITSITYPDQTVANFQYNPRGLLKSIPGVIDHYAYNPAGQNLTLALANNVTTTYQYDRRQRLESLVSLRQRDQLPLQSFRYHFDRASNITAIDDQRSDEQLIAIGRELNTDAQTATRFNGTQNFRYDSLYRLTQARNDAVFGTIDYRYDRIGNLLRQNATLLNPEPDVDLGQVITGDSGGTHNRLGRNPADPPGPHALTATEKGTDGTLRYDANGNVYQDGDKTLLWDAKDRLKGIQSGKYRAQYTYDYSDTRKTKVVTEQNSGQSQTTIYIDKFSEVREGKLFKYVYAGEKRVARSVQLGSFFVPDTFYLYNHIGSTNLALSFSSEILGQLADFPFGISRQDVQEKNKGPLINYRYVGKEADQENNLQYFEARYYRPSVNRFNSADLAKPNLNEPQTFNVYSYAKNNPINFYDPNGLSAEKFSDGFINAYLSNQFLGIGRNHREDDSVYTWGQNVGDAVSFSQGIGEILTGGFEIGGATAFCLATAGGGCAFAPIGAVQGISVVEHGSSVVGVSSYNLFLKKLESSGGSQISEYKANVKDSYQSDKKEFRTTRSGENAVRITKPDGSVIDISPKRVKEYVPNTHLNAPPGTLDKVKFPNAQPGSKGYKRDPTPEELKILSNSP